MRLRNWLQPRLERGQAYACAHEDWNSCFFLWLRYPSALRWRNRNQAALRRPQPLPPPTPLFLRPPSSVRQSNWSGFTREPYCGAPSSNSSLARPSPCSWPQAKSAKSLGMRFDNTSGWKHLLPQHRAHHPFFLHHRPSPARGCSYICLETILTFASKHNLCRAALGGSLAMLHAINP